LRYLAELAAWKQKRTLSSFIEQAIEESLGRVVLREAHGTTVADEAENLWDVDEPDRFVKLAVRYPDMLTYEEQVLWKLIRETAYLWRGSYNTQGEWNWSVAQSGLIFDRLRSLWGKLKQVASGESDKSSLPTVQKGSPSSATPTKKADFDDDIPF
jgi:hypothetical protein